MITIAELRREFRAKAADLRLDPRDVDLLLADCLDQPQSWLLAHGEEDIDPHAVRCFRDRIKRRFGGEPIQYIRSRAEFYGREFMVDPRVLIPRPETELLVESVLLRAPRDGRILDVGTGSGCIAITLKLERHDLRVTGTDLSIEAISVARSNATALGAPVTFACSDLLAGINGPFDVVVSNPPYVPSIDLSSLQTEVRDHEPQLALTSGPDGLLAIQILLSSGSRSLSSEGLLAFEIGFGQTERVIRLARDFGWSEHGIFKDLAGIDRVVILTGTDCFDRRSP